MSAARAPGEGRREDPARLPPQPIEYSSTTSIRGPLIVVEGVEGIGWNEVAEIRLADGEVRHGVVLDVHLDHAIVEVLEGTAGMRLDGVRTAFGGGPMSVPVTEEWLGRVCDGRGEPLDGGPPILERPPPRDHRHADQPRRPHPAQRADHHRRQRDRWARDARARPEAADLLSRRTSAPGARRPDRRPGPRRGRAVRGRVRGARGDSRRRGLAAGTLETRAGEREAVLFINTAEDPVVERLMTPRLALTVAEHLAFECDRHVLVLLADVTNYAEALRQVSAARGEVPTRRGYPGYLYSDLASLFERAGRMRGHHGSVTLVPVLTHARRRHHPSGAGPDRLHNRGSARPLSGPARARRLPAAGPDGLAFAPDAPGHRSAADA